MELSLPLPRRRHSPGTDRKAISDTRAAYALGQLRENRLLLRTTLWALVAVALLGGGWLWLRDSSLVGVRHVHIEGVHGVDSVEIREALDHAATRMTTMNFDAGSLRSAVSSFATVGAIHVTTSFPHTISIVVEERPPVAALVSAGQRTAVAADGTVLGPALLSSSLPTINGSVEPPAGHRVGEPAAVAAVTVLGAAPVSVARFVVRAFNGPEGLTVAMRNGLLVYFGDSTRPHAKWLSLARVLTSPSAAGASYIDVRLPERPAAGFSSTSVSSPSASISSPSPSSGSKPLEAGALNPTAAALAASLEKAVGAGTAGSTTSPSTSTPSSGESETSSGSASAGGTTGESEAPSGSSTSSSTGEHRISSPSSSGETTPSTGASEAAETPSG